MQVKRKLVFLISIVLDFGFTLVHIPHDEHNVLIETLLNMLQPICCRSFEFYANKLEQQSNMSSTLDE